MSNLRVIYDNAADRASLSSSATQTGLGVSNLLSDVKSKVCRSTGNTLSVYAAWPTTETIGGVAYAFTNLSPTTTARIRLTNETSATNLYKYSEQLDNSVWVKTACSVQPYMATAPDGSFTACKLVEDTANAFRECYQSIAVTSGVTYTHSAYLKPAGRRYVQILAQSAFFGFGHINFDLQTGAITSTNTGATGTIEAAPNGYYRVSVTMTAIATGTSRITTSIIDTGTGGHIVSYQGDGVSGVYVWGAQIEVGAAKSSYYPSTNTFTSRASAAWYIASDGTLKSATTNSARLSYNPNNLSAPPKLLLEAASTNLFTFSEQVDNAAWSKTNVTVTANATNAPDGNALADFIVESTANGAHEVRTPSVSLTSGTTYVTSCFAKQGTRRYVRVGFSTVFGLSNGYVVFDLQTGTMSSTGSATVVGEITAFANGWYRCSVRGTATATASGTNYVGLQSDSTTTSYTGDGASGLYLWGAQLETGPFATSYIQTTSATVTRAADVSTSAVGVRPLGYIDTWQSYTYDNGSVLFSPAPYKILHGLTQTQASSAYAYGGGKYACFWLPSKIAAYGMAIDITDTNNLQGYVEVSRLICGDYWAPSVVDVQGTSLQVVDTSSHIRTDAGDLYTYVGTKHRKQVLSLPSIESTSRKQLWDIMWGNGMSKPIFISTYANNADASLEAAHMLYGKLSQTPSMSTPYFNYASATIEIEEV